MFKNILLATDGSRNAKRAAALAADLAAAHRARLVIVSVAPLSWTADEVARMPQSRRFSKEVKAEMKSLRNAVDAAASVSDALYTSVPAPVSALVAVADGIAGEAEGVARRRKVARVLRVPLTGSPADRVLEHARKIKADLIVMGTRGLSDLGGLFLGSVSHKVMHLAPCPCLTVK